MTAVAPAEDPHTLLSRLSLADSTSPSGASSPVPTTPEANVAHLARAQARRVAKIARAETALWQPITPKEAGREVDPAFALKGKTLSLAPDGRGRIVHRAARNIYTADGDNWQVQLEGFHHHTDEEELQDPLTAASPYALATSSLWAALFDTHLVSGALNTHPVIVREATYGLRTEDGESAVGLGIKWARKAGAEGVKDEGGWAWIWGELEEFDDDDDEDEEEDGGETPVEKAEEPAAVNKEQRKRFKGVVLAKLVEDAEDEAEDAGVAVGSKKADE